MRVGTAAILAGLLLLAGSASGANWVRSYAPDADTYLSEGEPTTAYSSSSSLTFSSFAGSRSYPLIQWTIPEIGADDPGACCAGDGSCAVTLEAACGGTFAGEGTDCDPNPCALPRASAPQLWQWWEDE